MKYCNGLKIPETAQECNEIPCVECGFNREVECPIEKKFDEILMSLEE